MLRGAFLETIMSTKRSRSPAPPPLKVDDTAVTNAVVTLFDIGIAPTGRFGLAMRFDIGDPQRQLQMMVNDMPPEALLDIFPAVLKAVGVDRASAVTGLPCRVAYDTETGVVQRVMRFLTDDMVDVAAKVRRWAEHESKVTPASKLN